MPTHLTNRLVWHDNAWDGHICQNPSGNTSCILHKHIREERNETIEDKAHGKSLALLKDWLPPCSRDTGAYSKTPYFAAHNDPLEFRQLPPVTELVPEYSTCPSPYRWMREDNFRSVCEAEGLSIRGPDVEKDGGWVQEPDRQLSLLTSFWGKIVKGESLLFYYCKDGHPFDRDYARILIGIGRVKDIGPQVYFGRSEKHPGNYPVWSRRITQDFPAQGVRLPYQEYIQQGLAVESILCPIPTAAASHFSYVAEHISDDVAVTVLERAIRSVEQVQKEGKVPGDWAVSLRWLNEVLAELWRGRGPFPGLGSMLEFLDCSTGTTFQRTVLAPMAKQGKNALDYVLGMLKSDIPIPSGPHKKGLEAARAKWAKMPSRHALLSLLARFELSPAQFRRAADPDERAEAQILANEAQIVANPYLLCEMDAGTMESDPVSLDTIDHGMLPDGDAALFLGPERIAADDRRRIRAASVDILRDVAIDGDTVLELHDLFGRIKARFSEPRSCRPDAEVFRSDATFHHARLWTDFDHSPAVVAISRLRQLDVEAADTLRSRTTNPIRKPGVEPNWAATLAKRFGKPSKGREQSALKEKEASLATLFQRKLAILVGGAGTGKTTVLQVFLDELEKSEGKNPLLLLAPTGKARVRLATKTKREAHTIHQFLLRNKWLDRATFRLRESGTQEKATTVVVDECSMIPVDLFGTFLKALDGGALKRLILVGDPNQLPPIGPGRPFVDLLKWAEANASSCVTRLRTCMRTIDGGTTESSGLLLADAYRADVVHPADDEILASLAKGGAIGDLECHFWNGNQNMLDLLKERMRALLNIKAGDYGSFNASLGIDGDDFNFERCENWQILCATRGELSGSGELNRLVQAEFRGGLLAKARRGWNSRPFGDQEIVWCDKVIQIRNRTWDAWPPGAANLNYVANGEIGLVSNTSKEALDAGFSTQWAVTYRYPRGAVNEFLELGYAITTHKAQGSDFDVVFVIIPRKATTLSRELLYTALTRFRKKLVLLVENDLAPLLRLRAPEESDTEQRNTQMFGIHLRPTAVEVYRPEGLIHRTRKGVAVRSKSEVIVADALERLGLSYSYEKPLRNPKDESDFRLPDFTVHWQGEDFYWEHLGMQGVATYDAAWERKLAWYKKHGFLDQLVTSSDKPDGGIEVPEIERIARSRIIES